MLAKYTWCRVKVTEALRLSHMYIFCVKKYISQIFWEVIIHILGQLSSMRSLSLFLYSKKRKKRCHLFSKTCLQKLIFIPFVVEHLICSCSLKTTHKKRLENRIKLNWVALFPFAQSVFYEPFSWCNLHWISKSALHPTNVHIERGWSRNIAKT